jgi:hypothetical protein
MTELNQEAFEAWLFNQPRDQVVNPTHGADCVLCRFIKFDNRDWANDLYVGWHVFIKGRNTQILPEWAVKLIDPDSNIRELNNMGQIQDRYEQLFGPVTVEKVEPKVYPQGMTV